MRLGPTDLPVEDAVGALRAALAQPPYAAVLHAPPGAGKTTLVPLRLLDEAWCTGRIVVLEPRRLATRAAARRMASLLGEEVGHTVGYRTRVERHVSDRTRIEVVTEGILTRRLQRDPELPGTALVVFDEVHERNLQSDLGLALCLDVRATLRPDLRLLAMSATIDGDRFAALLGDGTTPAPIVRSEGRSFAVDVRWVPPPPPPRRGDRRPPVLDVTPTIRAALRDEPDGDVLVFLPGAADIRRAEAALMASRPADVDIRPLFGALRPDEQDLALAPSPPGRRKVVLATDIAETSLTVDGVTVVVDAGLARVPRYDSRTGLTRLTTIAASRASADQRAGRAGRTRPGIAYRCWSRLEHATRRPFADPEITQVDLAGFVLELACWGTDAAALRLPDQPPVGARTEAAALLRSIGALDDQGRPTPLGRRMTDLPLHPRLARMVLEAEEPATASHLAALLEERDVLRGRPDELPTDLTLRLRAVVARHHPQADERAVRAARDRAREIDRRSHRSSRPPNLDPLLVGRTLALAYPDRMAQARGGGRFRLVSGQGAWIASDDELVHEAFLAVAEVDGGRGGRDARIRTAAPLRLDDLLTVAGTVLEERTITSWDDGTNDLVARTERRVGALLLGAVTRRPEPGPDATRLLVDRVRATGGGALAWTGAARNLQRRIGFLRDHLGGGWPDLSDAALVATLDDWLGPRLTGATGRRDLAAVDVLKALGGLLDHRQRADLDRLAPVAVTVRGRRVAIDWAAERPGISVRVQDLFGTTTHPTIADGVPLVLHLLSPAGRPVQVTSDLPGFWAGSWKDVRREMAGRYPKHAWPADPAAIQAPSSRR